MKKRTREELHRKIEATLYKLLEKNEKRRKKHRDNYLALYSPANAPPEYRQALYDKQKKRL